MSVQFGFFPGEEMVVAGDAVDRIKWVLDHYPPTRDNKKLFMALYRLEAEGLASRFQMVASRMADQYKLTAAEEQELYHMLYDEFRAWYIHHAKSAKTVLNRLMEIQKNPKYEPSDDERKRRDKQSRVTGGNVR